MRRIGFVCCLSFMVGCVNAATKPTIDLPTRNGQTCNPISMGECLLPIPSAVWEKADSTTPTGLRLNLPDRMLPAKISKSGATVPLDPAPYNEADGWSPGSPIFVHFATPLDASVLPPHEDIARSLESDSPTVILDMETGDRVPHWAELDQNGSDADYKDRGLLIHPAAALERSHRYAVVITTGLKTADGSVLRSPEAFERLRDGDETGDAIIERLRPGYARIFSLADAAGIPKSQMLLAWDFHTASDEGIHRDILAMHEQAVAALDDDGISYSITEIESVGDASEILKVTGTYESPLFLDAKGDPYGHITGCKNERFGDCPSVGYVRDENGLPKQAGTWKREFIMIIPKAAVADATLPLVQFGHGLLGGGGEIMSPYNRSFAEDRGIVFIAHNWTGLSSEDVPIVSAALLNWNLFPITASRLGQGHIDAMALTYTARRIAADSEIKAALAIDHDPFDAREPTFYGISLGGIMGAGFMALNPLVKYGVLNVGGGAWSLMIQRSSNWKTYGAALATGYPSRLDQQILIVLSQILWDISDPIAFAPHVVKEGFDGVPAKQVLYQYAVEDSQVPNVASEKMVRSMGIPMITPSVRDVFGVATAKQAPSAFTVWDETPTPKTPRVNTPPSDNGTHGSIRDLPALKDQIERFLWGDHQIVNTCDGVCDPLAPWIPSAGAVRL